MKEPVNVVLLLWFILSVAIPAALYHSPDALEIVARKMRARARALVASREIYRLTYAASLKADATAGEVRKLEGVDK